MSASSLSDISNLSSSRDSNPLTRSSPGILPSQDPSIPAVFNPLSKSQEVFQFSAMNLEDENVPFTPEVEKMVLLRQASLAIPPPMPKPAEDLEYYKQRMIKIGRVASGIELPEEQWESAYPKASAPQAKLRNRYNNILPTDEGLVPLQFATNPYTHYINASRYADDIVITQGPLERTLADFWVLAFEQCTDIVCLTNHEEQGVEKTFPYWQSDSSVVFETKLGSTLLKVVLMEEPQIVIANSEQEQVIQRRFEITLGSQKKKVVQWHYINWPDQGVCDPINLANLMELLLKKPSLSLLFHCSAGIGRSGVGAVAIHSIHKYGIPSEDQIDQEVMNLREVRPMSIQGAKQRKLISDAIYQFNLLLSRHST